MKRYLSVFMLWARQCVYKLLLILLVMAAAEAALFYFTLERYFSQEFYSLETVLAGSHISVACAVGFLLLCALLCFTGCEFGARPGYTLSRLSVTKWGAFLCQLTHNTLCFLVFWAAQLGVVLGLCALYKYLAPAESYGAQTVFVAFYRDEFLHSLLPLEEGSRYVRNALLALALGASTALFSKKQRCGKKGILAVFMAVVTVIWFRDGMGSFGGDMLMSMISAAAILYVMLTDLGVLEEKEYEEY